jgi:hypothetical protein
MLLPSRLWLSSPPDGGSRFDTATLEHLLDGICSVLFMHSTMVALYFIHPRPPPPYALDALDTPPFIMPLIHDPRTRDATTIVTNPPAKLCGRVKASRPKDRSKCFSGIVIYDPQDLPTLFLKRTLSARACPLTYEPIYCSLIRFSHPLFACLDYALYLRRGRREEWVWGE